MKYVSVDKCQRLSLMEFKCMSYNSQKEKHNSSILDLTLKIEAVISETPKGGENSHYISVGFVSITPLASFENLSHRLILE